MTRTCEGEETDSPEWGGPHRGENEFPSIAEWRSGHPVWGLRSNAARKPRVREGALRLPSLHPGLTSGRPVGTYGSLRGQWPDSQR